MHEVAAEYRREYELFVDGCSNPWRYWMRSIAWNQIYTRYQRTTQPMSPGPWDEATRTPDPPGGLTPFVPVGMVPNLPDSWGSCCTARTPPPAPPTTFGSGASSSTAGISAVDQATVQVPPQWRYQGGKKRKWTEYEDGETILLEEAYKSGVVVFDLVIDSWDYSINFTEMTQTSHTTGTERKVQRVSV